MTSTILLYCLRAVSVQPLKLLASVPSAPSIPNNGVNYASLQDLLFIGIYFGSTLNMWQIYPLQRACGSMRTLVPYTTVKSLSFDHQGMCVGISLDFTCPHCTYIYLGTVTILWFCEMGPILAGQYSRIFPCSAIASACEIYNDWI